MNDFDFKLDRLEKISTIVIGILGFVATIYVTATVIIPGDKRNKLKDCRAEQKHATKQINLTPSINLEPIADRLSVVCDEDRDVSMKFLTDRQTSVQLNLQTKETTANDQKVASNGGEVENQIIGYVSLGPDADYQKSNFRDAASGKKVVKVIRGLDVGSILRARWSVNLRENNKNTESGLNNSLLVINDEECVRMLEKPLEPIRGSWWVKVALSSCN